MLTVTTTIEIIFLIFFLGIIFSFIKNKRSKEILFFVLPILVYYFFIEALWVYKGGGTYDKTFNFLIMGVPLIVPFVWVVVLFFAKKLTKKTFYKNRIIKEENCLLALGDAFWATLFAFVLFEPLALNFNLWYHISKEPFFCRAPLWYFVGWFLAAFLISFGYRIFQKIPTKKRLFYFYGYVFLIILVRLSVYLFLKF